MTQVEALAALPHANEMDAASKSGARSLWQSASARAILIIVVWKLATLFVIGLAYLFMPFQNAQRHENFIYPPSDKVSLATYFTTWDSSHYLYLAEKGYQPDQPSNWFLPLYPLTIRGLDEIVGNSIIAGLLIANVASSAGLYLFFSFVKHRFGADVALRSLLLFVAFPAAFFLSLIYTEGLFLLFAVLFFTFLYRRQFALAAGAALFLPMLRFVGLLIVVPFGVFIFTDTFERMRRRGTTSPKGFLTSGGAKLLYLLAPLAGLAFYFWYMHQTTGDAFAAQRVQSLYPSQWGVQHVLEPVRFLKELLGIHVPLSNVLNFAPDRIIFVAFVASIPIVYRRVDKTLFAWYLLMGLQPLLGSFMSYRRYLMVDFPVYVAFATTAANTRPIPPRVFFYLGIFQAMFIAFHVSNYWIA